MNYDFDRLLEISEAPYFNIVVAESGEAYAAIEVNTDTVSHGPNAIVALERLLVSLKINEGRDIIPEAEYATE